MKVLWLTRENPAYADRGDLLYSGGLIKALARRGAQVHVIATGRAEPCAFELHEITQLSLAPTLRSRAGSLLSRLPSDTFRLAFPRFREVIEAALQTGGHHAVIIDNTAMAWAVRIVCRYKTRVDDSLAIVYLSHNFERSTRFSVARAYAKCNPLRWLLYLDAWKYVALERRLLRSADLVTAITSEDAAALAEICERKPVLVVTPGYDCEHGDWFSRVKDQPRRCVIVGSFDWIAKRDNLRQFVRAAALPFSEAGIELQIVGRMDADFAAEISDAGDFCNVVGPVPDVRPYIRSARIGILPDAAGGGFKLKFLDYVFNGVVAAGIEAQMAGVPGDIQKHTIIGTTVERLVQAVVEKIDACSELERMRSWAQTSCEGAFDWAPRGQALYEAIEHVRAARANCDRSLSWPTISGGSHLELPHVTR